MSSLLEFHHKLADNDEAIYSIETGELNPTKVVTSEIKETRETFLIEDYSLATLRKYIQKHSTTLAENGNLIKGRVVPRKKVELIILKEI